MCNNQPAVCEMAMVKLTATPSSSTAKDGSFIVETKTPSHQDQQAPVQCCRFDGNSIVMPLATPVAMQ